MPSRDFRITLLRTAVIAGVGLVAITEILSFFGLLNRPAIAISWLLFLPLLRFQLPRLPAIGWIEWVMLVPLAAIVLLLGTIACISPPNSYDAMSYHMPRVVMWAQNGSVNFFPTPYLNQLQMPPLAEYLVLHTWLLTGGDRLANLPQWLGYSASLVAVSVLAREFGASMRGQIFAAIVAGTIPNAILQATGTKNDCVLSFWLLTACAFLRGGPSWLAAAAIALAVFTKGTAYLFLPPLIVALCVPTWRRAASLAGAAIVAVMAINGPFYWRNYQLSGSAIGFDSAHGDGHYRVRNDRFGLGATFSNAARGLAAHVAFRDPATNQRVHDTVRGWHAAFGLDPDDPATTWPESKFSPTANSNHESNSPNRWHLALLIVAIPYSLWRAETRRFAIGWIVAWILFFALLRWQPYCARLHLPLFFIGAVFIGVWLDKIRPRPLALVVCLLLINNARPFLFNNWLRPLEGPSSILLTERAANYFTDIAPLLNQVRAQKIVREITQTDCLQVGIDINQLDLEYPVMALLLQHNQKYKFRHTDVRNASIGYEAAGAPPPCAVIRLHLPIAVSL